MLKAKSGTYKMCFNKLTYANKEINQKRCKDVVKKHC